MDEMSSASFAEAVKKDPIVFLPMGASKSVRIQGAFIEDNDVHHIVEHWHAVTPIPQYAEEWLNLPSSSGVVNGEGGYEDDPLMEKALAVVRDAAQQLAEVLDPPRELDPEAQALAHRLEDVVRAGEELRARRTAADVIQRFEDKARTSGLDWSVRLEEGRPHRILESVATPGTLIGLTAGAWFDQGVLDLKVDVRRRLQRWGGSRLALVEPRLPASHVRKGSRSVLRRLHSPIHRDDARIVARRPGSRMAQDQSGHLLLR